MSVYEEVMKKLDELNERINPDSDEWMEDVRKTLSIFLSGEKLTQFRKTLECIAEEWKKEKSKEEKSKLLYGILKSLEISESDFLIENLKRKGYAIAHKNTALRDSINKESLRILEQVRLGKRDRVIGMLLRSFSIKNEIFPQELIEALKPKYEINLFRSFIYAFLGGIIISEEKEVENE